MSNQVDLRQLAVRRDSAQYGTDRRRRSHWLSRYVLPAAALLAFAAVLLWAVRDSLLPSKPVMVVPVLTSRAEIQQEGAPLFQAAGWVEPRPTPTVVSALAEGVIEELLVVEGQEVKAGEPVAKLIQIDAKLARDAAEATVRLRQAELTSCCAAVVAAQTNLDEPVHLRASLAEAEAILAQKQTERATLPPQLKSAEARERVTRLDFERKQKLSGNVAEIEAARADADWKMAAASVEELKAKQGRLDKEIDALTLKRDAWKRRLELLNEETRQLAEAEAQQEAAEARLNQAEVDRDTAKLRLDRVIVRAPAAGRILALIARPGMRVMGLAPGSLYDASAVVTMYDPARLQVRADVRLDDVPRVQPGMRVKIETPAAPGGPLEGEVLFSTSQADIQKNTLQVKVALLNPPPTLRPDMLVQATFLAPRPPAAADPNSQPLRVLVYRQLVDTGDGGSYVWLADQAAGRARRRPVQLGVTSGEFVEVSAGLTPADRLISGGREGLRDGDRIRVTGEDSTFVSITPSAQKSVTPSRLPTPQGQIKDHK
jgi:RND family efflux transporter MFP subunit